MIRLLEDFTGVSCMNVDIADEKVLSLFNNGCTEADKDKLD